MTGFVLQGLYVYTSLSIYKGLKLSVLENYTFKEQNKRPVCLWYRRPWLFSHSLAGLQRHTGLVCVCRLESLLLGSGRADGSPAFAGLQVVAQVGLERHGGRFKAVVHRPLALHRHGSDSGLLTLARVSTLLSLRLRGFQGLFKVCILLFFSHARKLLRLLLAVARVLIHTPILFWLILFFTIQVEFGFTGLDFVFFVKVM